MAPYGACEVAQSTARSKAQFEAERFRKGFRRKNESASEGKRSMFEQRFRALWPRNKKKKHARALISNAQRPQRSHFERSDAAESKLEQ